MTKPPATPELGGETNFLFILGVAGLFMALLAAAMLVAAKIVRSYQSKRSGRAGASDGSDGFLLGALGNADASQAHHGAAHHGGGDPGGSDGAGGHGGGYDGGSFGGGGHH